LVFQVMKRFRSSPSITRHGCQILRSSGIKGKKAKDLTHFLVEATVHTWPLKDTDTCNECRDTILCFGKSSNLLQKHLANALFGCLQDMASRGPSSEKDNLPAVLDLTEALATANAGMKEWFNAWDIAPVLYTIEPTRNMVQKKRIHKLLTILQGSQKPADDALIAQAYDIIPSALEAMLLSRSASVQHENLIRLVQSFTSRNDNSLVADILVAEAGVEAIVRAMKLHMCHAGIQVNGISALSCFVQAKVLTDDVTTLLKQSEAIQTVQDAMSNHTCVQCIQIRGTSFLQSVAVRSETRVATPVRAPSLLKCK